MNEDKSSLQLLGSSEHRLPEKPEAAILEVFANHNAKSQGGSGRAYTIHLSCEDFSSLCPVTGQPDAASIEISYVPREWCVETKSLKFYLASFRNQAAFNEVIVNRILDDLVERTEPVRLKVVGAFAARGGISLTAEAVYPDSEDDGG